MSQKPESMLSVIQNNLEIMGGTPVFKGTRVPVQTFFDYIEGDETIEAFLDDFPTVKKEQVIQLLEYLKKQALNAPKMVLNRPLSKTVYHIGSNL